MTSQSLTVAEENEMDLREGEDRPSQIAERMHGNTRRGISLETLPEAVEFAKLMCQAEQAVPAAFRRKPGLCLAVTMQAIRWGFDPFGVAQNAYIVNDKVAYEAKLIVAAINANAPLDEPLNYKYEGKDESRTCAAIGQIITRSGRVVERRYESPPKSEIKPQNSPLWKTDPDMQLAYYAARAFARRYFPDIMLGVVGKDESADMGSVINARERESLEERLKKAAPAKLPYANAAQANEDEDADRDDTSQTQEPDSPAHLMIGEAEAFDSATDLAEWSESLRQSEDFKALSQDERKTVDNAIARKSLALMEAAGEAETSEAGETGDGDDAGEETFPGDLTS
ncbi:hypothetical protein [Marinicauda sp. Alg238-R41]|uniref:hypothetical protein n=1 Tax=Marinicauda sp. Alg238-R41 TaxID=2993447 RepID=UPI0022E65598|nr:hypothetical protein [Marinicauda sp. Alg238-R41]